MSLISIPADSPTAPSPDEGNDIARVREFRRMKARLAEFEQLYATRFRHQVPTSTSEPKEKHRVSTCGFHLRVLVSLKTNLVECAVCEAPLDPLDVLRQYATEERNFAHTLEHLRNERDQLAQEIERLKRERSNLKAAIRRATKP